MKKEGKKESERRKEGRKEAKKEEERKERKERSSAQTIFLRKERRRCVLYYRSLYNMSCMMVMVQVQVCTSFVMFPGSGIMTHITITTSGPRPSVKCRVGSKN